VVEHFNQLTNQLVEIEQNFVQRTGKAFEDFTNLNGTNLAIGFSPIGHAQRADQKMGQDYSNHTGIEFR